MEEIGIVQVFEGLGRLADDVVVVPEIGDRRRLWGYARRGVDTRRVCGDGFGDHAALVVVSVGDNGGSIGGADEAVFAVPEVMETSVGDEVPVIIIGEYLRRPGDEDGGGNGVDGVRQVCAVGVDGSVDFQSQIGGRG